MSQEKKISIALIGSRSAPTMSLANMILGKTYQAYSYITHTYENDMFRIMNINDLDVDYPSEAFRKSFEDFQPDMTLIVIDNDEQREEISKQINKIKKITHQFIVVVPLSYDPINKDFKCCRLDELFTLLAEATKSHGSHSRSHPTATGIGMDKRHDHPLPTTKRYGSESHQVQYHTDPRLTGSCGSFNIILLGQTGSGKSASANTILGTRQFQSLASSEPLTRECQMGNVVIGGTRVTVIDTPDFFDENMTTVKHVKKCRDLCQSGSCVYLLVMQMGRFTDGERDILDKLGKCFAPEIREKTIILFTRGEDLRRSNMTLEAFVSGSDPHLKKIVGQCGNRVHVFENKSSDRQQVQNLMHTVQTLINGGQVFHRQGRSQGLEVSKVKEEGWRLRLKDYYF